MKVLITGATGFIGSHVARVFQEKGCEVRCLVRRRSSLPQGLDLEQSLGDLRDPESLERAVQKCDAVVHCAALYTFWTPRPREIYQTNLQGTQNLLSAARKAGVRRIVYTSTVSTLHFSKGELATEKSRATLSEMVGHYKRSKFLAEEAAAQEASDGLEVVIVNPTAPIGAWDVKPTPTGKIVLDFLMGKMPAFMDTGLNIVAVDDVAQGHWLAFQRGQSGERYLLGNRNVTLKELLELLAKITGKPAPQFKIPYALAYVVGGIDTFFQGSVLRRSPAIPLEAVRVGRKPMWVSCEKAIRELSLPQTPIEVPLGEAIEWFARSGYLKKTDSLEKILQ